MQSNKDVKSVGHKWLVATHWLQTGWLWRLSCLLRSGPNKEYRAVRGVVVCMIHGRWSYWYMWSVNRTSTLWDTQFVFETLHNLLQGISWWETNVHRKKLPYNSLARLIYNSTNCAASPKGRATLRLILKFSIQSCCPKLHKTTSSHHWLDLDCIQRHLGLGWRTQQTWQKENSRLGEEQLFLLSFSLLLVSWKLYSAFSPASNMRCHLRYPENQNRMGTRFSGFISIVHKCFRVHFTSVQRFSDLMAMKYIAHIP